MRTAQIKQLFRIIGGKPAPKGDNAFSGEGTPFIKMKDLGRAHLSNNLVDIDQRVSDAVAKKEGLNLIRRGAILLPRSGSVALNHRAVLGIDAYMVSHICALEVIDPKEVSNFYAYYYLRSIKMDRISKKTTGLDAITFEDLGKLSIPLPDIDDQIRIAHLLGKVEGLIAQRKQHLQQLDDLLKSVFLEMFGDPVRNERGWTPVPLEQLGSINRGVSKHRPRNDPKLLGGPHPLIQTGEVSNAGTYITTYTQTYSDLGIAQSKLWPAGTLCITIAANIAQAGILTFDACFPDSVVGFLAHEGESNTLYVLGLFWFFQAILEKNAPAAAQKNINLEILRALSVPKPPIELQREFATIVEKVEALKSRYQQSLTDFEALYGALSQQAFKGELDLSRVPLLGIELEKENTVAAEPLQISAAQSLAIHLPDTDNLPAALESAEARKNLLAHWLEAYRGKLGSTPFSVQHFMAAAQTRLAELHPDNDFELAASDYEHIKAWVFEALTSGRFAQAFDNAGNRIELKAVQA